MTRLHLPTLNATITLAHHHSFPSSNEDDLVHSNLMTIDNADNNARDFNAQLRYDLLNGYSYNIFDDISSPKYDKLAYPWEYISWQNQTTTMEYQWK